MDIEFYIGHSLSVFPSSVKMSHCPTIMLSVREIHGPGVRGLPWVQESNKHTGRRFPPSPMTAPSLTPELECFPWEFCYSHVERNFLFPAALSSN